MIKAAQECVMDEATQEEARSTDEDAIVVASEVICE